MSLPDAARPVASSRGQLSGAIVVTGAGGGIGSLLAAKLISSGSLVVLTDVNAERLESLDVAVTANAEVVVADAADATGWNEIVGRTLEKFGAISGLANVAGYQGPASELANAALADFARVWERNVVTSLLGLQAVWPQMKIGGSGAIVNVSSVAGLRGVSSFGLYSAAKHALLGLTRTGALEGAPLGIRVNAICPGPTETSMMDEVLETLDDRGDPRGLRQRMERANPMGRFATSAEVADAIAWLLSDESSYVNGAIVPVDGGLTAA